MSPRTRRAGFTLLEMMAVVVLMGIVLGVAIDFYLDLSKASYAATTDTGHARRALVLLDRVARDLEGTVLLKKPADVDPLAWQWLFLADSEGPDDGADRVKFVRRGRTPRSSDLPESDLEVVAWIVAQGPDGDLELRRASSPQLPDKLDRSFPDAGQSDLVTGGLASFGIRFEGEDGQWSGRWDSSQITDSSELPLAAEIEVSFATGQEGVVDGPYVRKVLLPLRPLDLASQLDEAEGVPGADVAVTDLNGDGKVDEKDEKIAKEQAAENGDESDDGGGTDAGSTVSLAECMSRDASVKAIVNQLSASNPDVAKSLLTLPVSMVAQQFGVAVPAACQ